MYNLMQTIWEFEFYCCRKWWLTLSDMSQILPNECLYILQIFCSFSESFSHPGDEGMGETRTTFSLGVVQFFHSTLFVFGVFSYALLQDGFLNSGVSVEWGNNISLYFPSKIICVQLGRWGDCKSVLSLLTNTVSHAVERWDLVLRWPSVKVCSRHGATSCFWFAFWDMPFTFLLFFLEC